MDSSGWDPEGNGGEPINDKRKNQAPKPNHEMNLEGGTKKRPGNY